MEAHGVPAPDRSTAWTARRKRRRRMSELRCPVSLGLLVYGERVFFVCALYYLLSFRHPTEAYVNLEGLELSLPSLLMALNILWLLLIFVEMVSLARAGYGVAQLLVYSGLPLGVLVAAQVALFLMARTVT